MLWIYVVTYVGFAIYDSSKMFLVPYYCIIPSGDITRQHQITKPRAYTNVTCALDHTQFQTNVIASVRREFI